MRWVDAEVVAFRHDRGVQICGVTLGTLPLLISTEQEVRDATLDQFTL